MTAAPRPHLLFLCHRIPYPPDKGEKIRGWHVLRHLAERYRVHVGCLVAEPGEMAHVETLAAICESVGAFHVGRLQRLRRAALAVRPGRPLMPGFYHDPRLARWVRQTLVRQTLAREPVEIVWIVSVAMAPYALHLDQRLILDAIDIDSEKWAAYATRAAWPMRAVWAREARTLLSYERHAAARVERTLFVSSEEARRFVELAPECAGRAAAVDNGVDLDRFSPGTAFADPFAAPALVFTGHMDYRPNEDAVQWFAHAVLPLVRARRAAVEFWIVGASPTPRVAALAGLTGVHVTGRVADVRPYLAHASVVVCPLRMARGIQNKVLEAMAMGRPVVATAAAFEGVRAMPGRDLLVMDEAAAWAAAIDAILAGAYPALGANARAAMERSYAWPAVLAKLDPILRPAE